jgi:two-component system LytT family sensor kinase
VTTTRTARGRGGRGARPLLADRQTWVLTSLFWVLAAAIGFAAEWLAADLTGALARLVEAISWWALTILAIALSDFVPVRDPRPHGALAFHAAAGAAAALLQAAAVRAANAAIVPGWDADGWSLLDLFGATYLTTLLLYLVIVLMASWNTMSRESRDRAVEAAESRALATESRALATESRALATEAQLQALKMELQPHFLFNALNAVSALMQRDVDAANEMLVLLADMLAASIDAVHEQEVELARELETLRIYVRIQQIRLGDRLRVDWDVDPDTLRSRVPHLILQPLVENAILHGIEQRAAGGRVEIGAHRNGARLELLVRDDGAAAARPTGTGGSIASAGSAASTGHGLGLANTRARLQHLYGEEARFALLDDPSGGTIAFLSIPSAIAAPPHRPATRP